MFSNNYVLFDKELLWSNTNEEVFETSPKLINRQTSSNLVVAYDDNKMYSLDSTHCQTLLDGNISLKALMCLENSRLINFVYDFLVNEEGRTFAQVKTVNLKKLPIIFPNEQSTIELEKLANRQIMTATSCSMAIVTFSKYLKSQFSLEKLSRKLQNWHELAFGDFIKELNKAIVKRNREVASATTREHAPLAKVIMTKLTKLQEMEWMEVFEAKKAEAQQLKTEIDKTDNEIDAMVYELYGLSEEEIAIVEGSNN